MLTVNESLRDEAIAHSVWISRYATGVANRMVKLLNETDADLSARLLDALDRLPADSFTVTRLESLLGSVRELNRQAVSALQTTLQSELREFAEHEAGYQLSLFDSLLPGPVASRYPLQGVTADMVYATAMSQPFQGRLLSEWAENLESDRLTRIVNAVRRGYLAGDTTETIARSVRGHANQHYRDGAIQMSRANAASIAKTAVNHVAATARNSFANANSDIAKGKQWLSTLDSRTTHTCFVPETSFALFGEVKHFSSRGYSGFVNIIRTAGGNQLKGTPNHPILTTEGWRPLNKIQPGEQVFEVVAGERFGIERSEDVAVKAHFSDFIDSSGMPTIGEVFMESATAAQFHGDGMSGEQKVNISRLAGDLRDNLKPRRYELIVENLLGIRKGGIVLSRLECFFFELLGRRLGNKPAQFGVSAFKRLVEETFATLAARCREEPSQAFNRLNAIIEQLHKVDRVLVYEGVVLASSEYWHSARFSQKTGDSGSRYAVLFSEFDSGNAVLVSLDNVVSVSCEFGSYHVCNLHSDSEIYIANRIIVHNCIIRDRLSYTLEGKPIGHRVPYLQGPGRIHFCCRSTETLILKSWRELGLDIDEMDEGTRASMDGQVAAETNYRDWLERQPYRRQVEVLGEKRARLMRDGGMSPDEFYTDRGEWLTLEQLRERDEQAFRDAGI